MVARKSTAPVLDFDPIDPGAHEHLLTFLVSPFDARKRRQFLAMRAAVLVERAPQHVDEYLATAPTLRLRRLDRDVALARYTQVLKDALVIPSGGLNSLIESPSLSQWEIDVGRMRRGPILAAGRLLLFVAQLAHHHQHVIASTRRAHEILRAWKKAGGEGPADRELTQLWKRYGGVAPLYAAMLVSMEEWPADDARLGVAASTVGSVRRVLAQAAWFRDFALRHKPSGAAAPLLRPAKALVLPPEIKPEEPPLRPLPAALLKPAVTYLAPQPAQ
jgi:hypothetical protein